MYPFLSELAGTLLVSYDQWIGTHALRCQASHKLAVRYPYHLLIFFLYEDTLFSLCTNDQ